MTIGPAIVSPLAALFGTLVGGITTFLAAVYTQRRQDRLQRIASEAAKRESVYADFVTHASNMLLNAYVHDDIVLTGDEQRLIGLINRMRFFAPARVVETAEGVLRAITEIALKPSIELRKLATEAVSKKLDPDPLLTFSLVCREDLDDVRRGLATSECRNWWRLATMGRLGRVRQRTGSRGVAYAR